VGPIRSSNAKNPARPRAPSRPPDAEAALAATVAGVRAGLRVTAPGMLWRGRNSSPRLSILPRAPALVPVPDVLFLRPPAGESTSGSDSSTSLTDRPEAPAALGRPRLAPPLPTPPLLLPRLVSSDGPASSSSSSEMESDVSYANDSEYSVASDARAPPLPLPARDAVEEEDEAAELRTDAKGCRYEPDDVRPSVASPSSEQERCGKARGVSGSGADQKGRPHVPALSQNSSNLSNPIESRPTCNAAPRFDAMITAGALEWSVGLAVGSDLTAEET
jgi:hypothetical protein